MSDKALLSWKSFPLVDRPKTSVLVVSFFIFIAVSMWGIAVMYWKQPFFYIFGILLFFAELLPYFIPTYYVLEERKIKIKYWIMNVEREYKNYHCFYADKHGIMLSTYSRPNKMDRFRGQSLRFSKERSEVDELKKILKQKVGKEY